MDLDAISCQSRIELLDFVRGLTLVSMIFYHLCYNLYYLFDHSALIPWFSSAVGGFWQETICVSFLLLAGVCAHFTRRPYLRTLKLAGCALLITVVTWLAMPGELIVFGILHCMTLCTLFFAVCQPLLRRIPPGAGLVITLLLYAVTFSVPRGTLGIGALSVALPRSWYASYWLSILGLLSPDFFSADYFPIFPYLFVFLGGYYLYPYIAALPRRIRSLRCPPINFLGRHSLFLYLLHQPVLYGAMLLFFCIFSVG